LPDYSVYYAKIPGLDYSPSFILRMFCIIRTAVFRNGELKKYSQDLTFVSGLICIPKKNEHLCMTELKAFFASEIDLLG